MLHASLLAAAVFLSPVFLGQITPGGSSPDGDQTDEAVGAAQGQTVKRQLELVPEQWRTAVARSLGVAGDNEQTWLDALDSVATAGGRTFTSDSWRVPGKQARSRTRCSP